MTETEQQWREGSVPWLEDPPNLSEVKAWISASLPDHPEVHGPTHVYTAYNTPPDVRVAARFWLVRTHQPEATEHLGPGHRDDNVVFRANFLPHHARSAAVYALISRLCPEDVPSVLAWEPLHEGWFMICRPFEGEIVENLKSLDALQDTARTLARIQVIFSAASEAEKECLDRVGVTEVPGMFGTIIANIREKYEAVWRPDNGPLTKALGFPAAEVLVRLEPLQERIASWAGELESGRWLLSVDHGDLHAGNAVRLADGRVIIFDWENALVSCPFFLMDRLMVSAWNLDNGSSGPWGFIAGTPSQVAVRNAYLDALPWGRRTERESAFDRALCLATIKEMYTEMLWARATGWKDDNPEWTAQLVRRLLQYVG